MMLSFLHPWVLLALFGLPLVWRLLNALPPAPVQMPWPPVALLEGIRERTPPVRHPPWWLVLLRCLLVALLLVAAAGPQWRPTRDDAARSDGEGGTILLVIDDGFAAAEDWAARKRLVARLLTRFAAENARFILVGTAPHPGDAPAGEEGKRLFFPLDGFAARAALESMVPSAFAPAHGALADRLDKRAAQRRLPADLSRILWLSDGMRWKGTGRLTGVLARLAPLVRLRMPASTGGGPYALLPPQRDDAGGWRLAVVRPPRRKAVAVRIVGLSREGTPLGTAIVRFAAGATRAATQWRAEFAGLPLDRFELRDATGARGAARVWRLDRRARGRRIAIVAGPQDSARPFAAPVYYLDRALRPLGTVLIGGLDEMISRDPDVLVISNRPKLAASLERRLADWLERGGLLIRFAGPAYGNETDSLHPLALARGARVVGGSLSWERPRHLASFPADGPFAGLRRPETVTVSGQVLALPGGGTSAVVLARLDDGTPLISSAARAGGRIVFFHSSADAQWTNLPLDPLFASLLRRILWLAPAVRSAGSRDATAGDLRLASNGLLAPRLVLDGFGALMAPPATVAAIPLADLDRMPISPMAPAGLYGTSRHPFVRNLQGPSGVGVIGPDFRFKPATGQWSEADGLLEGGRRDLAGPLALLAFLMLVADLAATGWLKGWMRPSQRSRARRPGAIRMALLIIGTAMGAPFSSLRAQAVDDDAAFAIAATRETRIGYIATGDAARDERVRSGLAGLARLMRLRTSVRLAEPMAIDPARRTLALFALVYWMPRADDPPLSPGAAAGIARYLAAGGILFVDLAGDGRRAAGAKGAATLARLLGDAVPVPPLVPLDEHHILARSFYLLDWFPGRREGAPVWVSADSFGDEPKVSPIIIGRNGWADAWAVRGDGGFLVSELAGGLEQREYAFRFGVNLVIYALAGTYKGDQIHLDAILDRLKR